MTKAVTDHSTKAVPENAAMQRRFVPYAPWIICVLLVAITLAVYFPVRGYDFINYDDDTYVYENPHVQNGLVMDEIVWAFTRTHAGLWLPLTWISFMVDSQLFGTGPGGFHLMNVAWHSANAVLIFYFFWRTTGFLWRSALLAALFAWHPLRVESVVWVTERKDVLSTFFGLLSILLYVAYVQRRDGKGAGEKGRKGEGENPPGSLSPFLPFYLLSLLFFALSLMSKPLLVTLPFALLLLDFWPLERVTRARRIVSRLILEKIPFFILSAVISIVTVHSAEQVIVSFPLHLRLENAVVSYARYLGKTFWPEGLALYYPYPESVPVVHVTLALVLLLALTSLAIFRARVQPYLFVSWFWFLGTLVPNIGLIQAGQQAMADRFSYLPHIGLIAGIVWAVADGFGAQRRALKGFLAVGGLAGSIIMTAHLLPFWKDSISVSERALAVTKNNYFAHHNLAAAFFTNGQKDRAEKHFLETVRICPDFPPVYNNLGLLLLEKGQTNAALDHFRTALRIKPGNFTAHCNLATALFEQGKLDEAAIHFQKAIELNPHDADVQFHFGTLLLRQNKTAAAVDHWRQAIRVRRGWPEVANNLAWLLATNPDPAIRNGKEAVAFAEEACRAIQPPPPAFLATLAAAYAEAGRFNDAVSANAKAIEGLKNSGDTNTIARFEQRTALYASQKPYREE